MNLPIISKTNLKELFRVACNVEWGNEGCYVLYTKWDHIEKKLLLGLFPRKIFIDLESSRFSLHLSNSDPISWEIAAELSAESINCNRTHFGEIFLKKTFGLIFKKNLHKIKSFQKITSSQVGSKAHKNS